ncbi:hypothetical protein [Francisella philomiragia]|uniref:Uncharacterized protein n=1 Tax=Francisella philomiragia TaxID=28110 RepID=A0ABS1GAM9_9GAMM|nr:hypothetical protein [Francisella philomiragia]MBK2267218.1 hypothetical protein [Francisella philomiragia]MBK2278769.1 hypothetical protein [Francisella philomiragia]MBK2286623.1 hypothetical protein [Francisella philomiragia]MBK2288503.1 hypothetical protein [Francisella philomiragia]MBK2290224.1 hypothetical protein [Francisella philomiragia]
MKNYRYQGYNVDSGSLLLNQTNVDKLYETQEKILRLTLKLKSLLLLTIENIVIKIVLV